MNAETSAHVSDVQDQLRLNTSSLQSLTANHAFRSKRLQNGKSRHKTIETKLGTVSRESQELMNRNAELVEQIQVLELQLDKLGKKHDADRVNHAMEKEQWGRMLEMENRLQAKSAEERRKFVEQISTLARRVATHEDIDVHYIEPTPSATNHTSSTNFQSSQVWSEAQASITLTDNNSLRRELTRQETLVDQLVSTLNDVTQRSLDLDGKARELIQQSAEIRKLSAAAATVESSARSRDASGLLTLQQPACPKMQISTILMPTGTELESQPTVIRTSKVNIAQNPEYDAPRGAAHNIDATCSNNDGLVQSDSTRQEDSVA
jgi:Skp family chaperone for outer membrane proteins